MRVLLIVVVAASSACAATGGDARVPSLVRAAPRGAGRPAPNGGAAPTGTLPVRTGGYEVSGTALRCAARPTATAARTRGGFDCSGFVWYVFAQHGVAVPRTVAEQFRRRRRASRRRICRPGDLVFFTTTGSGASHVGIVVGGDRSSTPRRRAASCGSSGWGRLLGVPLRRRAAP